MDLSFLFRRRLIAALALAIAPSAFGANILVNGDFETGDFTGWTVVDAAGGSGTFVVDNDGTTPNSSSATAGPASGNFYAVSDQSGPGAHALLQTFTVLAGTNAILSFDMFVNDWSGSGGIVNPAGLDYTAGANQHARVDILLAGAGAFDTGAGVLGNFFLGVDSLGGASNPYTSYTFDITSIVGGGGTFQLRFAEADNQLYLNQGVDNVSIDAAPVPEPQSMLLLASGLFALGWFKKSRYSKV